MKNASNRSAPPSHTPADTPTDLEALQTIGQGAKPLDPGDLPGIYRALRRGVGHEMVNDRNVDDLIALARQHDDAKIEALLNEWRLPCGNDGKDSASA